MYGGKFSRSVDRGDGIPLSHVGVMPRRQNVYGGTAEDGGSRGGSRGGKVAVDEEQRLGGVRGDFRVSAYLGGKSRGVIEQGEHHRSDDPYDSIAERRTLRDDGMLKMVRTSEDAPLRLESGGVRLRDGHRGERIGRPTAATYTEDSKWAMKGYDTGPNYGTGSVGSPHDSDYLSAAKVAGGGSSPILPGFVFECHRRAILEFSAKESFLLPLVDRRLSGQVGPGTKIFMYDAIAREMHGVFQAENFPVADHDTRPRVRVRVVKECMPLNERQFKEILEENYYSNSKFPESLSREQVMKMLQTFRPANPDRAVLLSVPSTRRTLESAGLPHTAQDFHGIPDELVYRKEERWRRNGGEDARDFGGHAYQSSTRFLSKLPSRTISTKELEEYEDYVDDEAVEDDLPVSPPPSRMVTGSNPFSSRDKLKFGVSLPPTKRVGHSDYKIAAASAADWREEINSRGEVLYRKGQLQSPSRPDELKRGGGSSSPSQPMSALWKDDLGEVYERQGGRGAGFQDVSYMNSRRRRHNDIDLNMPLDMDHGDPEEEEQQQQPQRSKVGGTRRVWDDDERDERDYSPPKRRSVLLGSSPLRLSDHLITTREVEDFDEPRLDSSQMMNVTRKDLVFLQAEPRARPVPGAYVSGKFGRPHTKPSDFVKKYTKDNLVPNSLFVRRAFPGKDSSARGSALGGPNAPLFKIKATLQPEFGKGRPERVVTLVDREGYRAWGSGSGEGFSNGSSNGEGRKRKASVWSRIKMPDADPVQSIAPPTNGRGRVFSRLGPSTNAIDNSYEPREMYLYRTKRPRPFPTEPEGYSEGIESLENSPEALGGDDYLHRDFNAVEESSDGEAEKAAEDMHCWTRKKTSIANSGGDAGIPNHPGESGNGKGGRRKLVRPAIGTKGQVDVSQPMHRPLESLPKAMSGNSERNGVQPSGRLDSMDVEVAKMKEASQIQAVAGFAVDPNSPADDGRTDVEDDIMSS